MHRFLKTRFVDRWLWLCPALSLVLAAVVLLLFGFLLQWPTLLTLLMFPILLVMYARLAVTEETEMREQFGEQYEVWAARTPRFLPAFGANATPA